MLTLSGCFSLPFVIPRFSEPLSVWQSEYFEPSSKTLVSKDRSQYDSRLRRSLGKYGFEVQSAVPKKTTPKQGQEGYGLKFTYHRQQKCMWNNEWQIHGVYEISDLKTDEVMVVLEKGGVTGPCKDLRDQVFPELAKALNEVWNP